MKVFFFSFFSFYLVSTSFVNQILPHLLLVPDNLKPHIIDKNNLQSVIKKNGLCFPFMAYSDSEESPIVIENNSKFKYLYFEADFTKTTSLSLQSILFV